MPPFTPIILERKKSQIMANYPRKILFAAEPEKNPVSDKQFSSECYMCYSCPSYCYVPPPPPPPQFVPDPEKTHVSTVLIFMLCILGVSFLIFSCLTIVRNRLRNSRSRYPEEPLQNSMADFLDQNQGPVLDHHIWYIRTIGLPQSVIDSIESFLYKKGDGSNLIDCNDCSICLSKFDENDRLRILPKCSHAFHVNCIDTWLRSHKNCPVCRAPILITTQPSPTESGPSRAELPSRGEDERDESRPIEENRVAVRNKRGRVLSDIVDRRVKLGDRELRRSASVDFSSAPAAEGGEGCSETKVEKLILEMVVKRDSSICRLIKSASCVHYSLQKGPVSMKRSFSLSGKRSGRKNSTSLESLQILD